MEVKYFKEYSNCLNRDMEFKVFGYAGIPLLVFPAQDGHFYDFENFNMVNTVSDKIDAGLIQLFCVDSIDSESWSDYTGNNKHRTYMHEQWYYYIIDELIPRINNINGNNAKIITVGCSLGATHAVNFMFRRPDLIGGCIAMSGYYDCDIFFNDYHDDITYCNSPLQYLEKMSFDHPYIEMYRQCKIIISCGQGRWEQEMIKSTGKIQALLQHKDIPAWVDYWGNDVDHDWTWWRVQFPYFVEKIL